VNEFVVRILSLGGVLGPALFTAVVILCGARRPGYSHVAQLISELGASGTTHTTLMNVGGFIPAGVLMAGFGIATGRLLKGGTRAAIASGLLTLFGVGVMVAGVYSCDLGCPQPPRSTAGIIHDRVSVAAFLAGIVGIGLWALEFRRLTSFSDLWLYGAISSIVALGLFVALAVSLETRVITGLLQRLLLGTLFLWCGIVALRLARYRTRARQ
jgi:hypothetical membrane protein